MYESMRGVMGKASKWLRRLLIGKKKDKNDGCSVMAFTAENRSVPAAKEKRRWSFRRSVGSGKELNSPEPSLSGPCRGFFESEIDQKRHAVAVAVATAAAADAAVAAAQAAAEVVRLTAVANGRTMRAVEEAAAIRIQSVFRSHLARKALSALKGLVKLQALVRGHLVRKQATATLRCMQALVNAQARARAKRVGVIERPQTLPHTQQSFRRSPQHSRFRQSFDMTRNEEEYVKIVEMDIGDTTTNSKFRTIQSNTHTDSPDQRSSAHNPAVACTPIKANHPPPFSPSPSTLTETNPFTPKALSSHFDEFSFNSPHLSTISMPANTFFDHPLHPNYMANTESSRAKARSQSAPRPRVDAYERQLSKRRPSIEGRNNIRGIRMQRSSSHVGLTANGYQYPWSLKLDRSNISFKGSECGSTSTILTDTNYCYFVESDCTNQLGNIINPFHNIANRAGQHVMS